MDGRVDGSMGRWVEWASGLGLEAGKKGRAWGCTGGCMMSFIRERIVPTATHAHMHSPGFGKVYILN